MALIPPWDFYAFLMSVMMGALAVVTSRWISPFEEFELWDYGFCIGVPIYIYVKNAKSREQKEAQANCESERHRREVAMCPPLDGLAVLRGAPVKPFDECAYTAVVSFQTTCAPSRRAFGPLGVTAELFREDGVQMVAVTKEAAPAVGDFLKSVSAEGVSVKFSVAVDGANALGRLKEKLNVKNTPHVFVVTSGGNVAWHGHPNALESMLGALGQVDEGAAGE